MLYSTLDVNSVDVGAKRARLCNILEDLEFVQHAMIAPQVHTQYQEYSSTRISKCVKGSDENEHQWDIYLA